MILKQIIEVFDIMDNSRVTGMDIAQYLKSIRLDVRILVKRLDGPNGSTDLVKILIPGSGGKSSGGRAPTIGLLGRLGGIGARPEMTGFVSDGDGALTAISLAAKLIDMQNKGDILTGDVFISTHICPNAPTAPHTPVPFMGSAVEMSVLNKEEISPELDAILSVDTTKGNQVINKRGFAISPTVKEGYILKPSEDLLRIMQITSGKPPCVFPLAVQDITPYGNRLHHLNSILQPCTATDVPVVGVAITTETIVPGCSTGATHFEDLEEAGRFMLETAKAFGKGECKFYDEEEFALIQKLYGSAKHFQTLGRNSR